MTEAERFSGLLRAARCIANRWPHDERMALLGALLAMAVEEIHRGELPEVPSSLFWLATAERMVKEVRTAALPSEAAAWRLIHAALRHVHRTLGSEAIRQAREAAQVFAPIRPPAQAQAAAAGGGGRVLQIVPPDVGEASGTSSDGPPQDPSAA